MGTLMGFNKGSGYHRQGCPLEGFPWLPYGEQTGRSEALRMETYLESITVVQAEGTMAVTKLRWAGKS